MKNKLKFNKRLMILVSLQDRDSYVNPYTMDNIDLYF